MVLSTSAAIQTYIYTHKRTFIRDQFSLSEQPFIFPHLSAAKIKTQNKQDITTKQCDILGIIYSEKKKHGRITIRDKILKITKLWLMPKCRRTVVHIECEECVSNSSGFRYANPYHLNLLALCKISNITLFLKKIFFHP